MKKIFKYSWKIVVAIGSAIIWILTIPFIRDLIWRKAKKVGEKKIIDAEAKIVERMRK